MARTAADVLADRLIDWGVRVIFGLPGDGINGIMEALRRRQESISFVQVRHEESAAFMACGYAKYTGRLGVCLATSGPGAIHLLNGLYDAKMDGAPVLAITGQTYHDLIARSISRKSISSRSSRTSRSTASRFSAPATYARWLTPVAERPCPNAASPTSHARSTCRSRNWVTTSRRRRRSTATLRTPGGRRSSCRATRTFAPQPTF